VINIFKSTTVPPSLAIEKAKKSSENYRSDDVMQQLRVDFHNKCYLCQDYAPSTINVEHFVPHRGDRDLLFDWFNLFYACGHCNNLKGAIYDNILNCTDASHKISDWIQFSINPYPKEKVLIQSKYEDIKVKNTVELLLKIYNGEHTGLKTIEGENIRERLIDEMVKFTKRLKKYSKPTILSDDKARYRKKIQKMLSVKSPFTAFKVWVIKENTYLMSEFEEFLP
jgi:5-methylcytosine-specific restriction endonuclease McrA